MSEARIQARIDGREAARDLHAMLVDDNCKPWVDGTGADYAEALLKELASLLPSRTVREPEPEKPLPLARLAAEVIDFGLHAGKTFDNVPLDYLDWLCRAQEEFLGRLRAYLKHPDRRD